MAPIASGSLRACLISGGFLFCVNAWAQLGVPSAAPVLIPPEVPQDALGRTTPRGTVLGFLSAARTGKNEGAAQYLNTRMRGAAAATLASQLFTILDRRLPARHSKLSDRPEGSVAYPAQPHLDLV